ncbi:DUF6783 domain-containing protein [Blautia acetigignens]
MAFCKMCVTICGRFYPQKQQSAVPVCTKHIRAALCF